MARLGGLFGRKNPAPGDGERCMEAGTSGAPAGVYGCVGAVFLRAGRDEVVVSVPGSPPALVPRNVAEILARCASFRSLEEHARAVAEELDVGDAGRREVLAELGRCAEAGLLRSLSAALGAAAAAGAAEPDDDRAVAAERTGAGAPAIASFGIVSANRVACARRAFESYMDNARRFGREPEWALYDDSADPSIRGEYRAMLGALGEERGLRILYSGYEEKLAYARALAGEGFPMATLEFCLFGMPDLGARYGANRNARLLDTAGMTGVVSDDDTLCDMGASPSSLDTLRFITGDPTEFFFFQDIPEARASLERMDEDYLALHEGWLGRSLRACACGSGPPELSAFDKASDVLVASLASGRGRVAVTQMGLAGDSGMGSSFYYLFLEGATRERLIEKRAPYREYMESRAVVRMAEGPALCDCPPFMNYAAALDNRLLLPPFVPSLRASDNLFAQCLRILLPEAFFAYLPRTVGHEPPERRRSDRALLRSVAAGIGASDCVTSMLRSFPPNAIRRDSVAERTRALGRHLFEAGRLPAAELEELLSAQYLREKARLLAEFERLLDEESEGAEERAEDIADCREALREALPLRESHIPRDIRGGEIEARLAAFSQLLRCYGELLTLWPDMIVAAKSLRERGIRPAAAI